MENFNYQSTPFHCLHCPNPSCVRSASCLRHLAAQRASAEMTHIMAVNSANYPAEADRCVYFHSTEKQRYAWGISSLFDSIPYRKTVYLERETHDFYPHITYHHILHQECALSSGEQEEIAALSLQTGIDEVPAFGRYTDGYNWDEQHTPEGNAAPQLTEWMNG